MDNQTWIAGHLDGDGSVTISDPGGKVMALLPPADTPTLEDALYEIRSLTDGRVDVRWIDFDGYETLEST